MSDFQRCFDPNSYCELYFKDPKKQNSFLLEKQHQFWSSVTAKGVNSLLEYGAGPTISRLISASRHVNSIIAAEYLETNRKALLDWIAQDPKAFNWRPSFDFVVRTLEGKSEAEVEKREKDLREKIKAVVHCDLRSNRLEIPSNMPAKYGPPFDIVSTCLCIESVVKTEEEYKNAVKNLADFVRPGGYLVKIGTVDCTFYTVGDTRFSNFAPSKDLVLASMKDAGIVNVVYKSSADRPPDIVEKETDESDLYDGQGFFFTYGEKK